MKKIIFTVIVAVVLALGAWWAQAADIDVIWDAAPGATEYRVYMSVDNGVTWSATPVATGTTLPITVTVPDSGLVLLRGANFNSLVGEVMRYEAVIGYNGDWALDKPTGLGHSD